MLYFSPILSKAVKDETGKHLGRVYDMIVVLGENFPKITDIIESRVSKKFRIHWDRIKHLDHEEVIIKGHSCDFPEFEPNGEIMLKRDILDKQIVDVKGQKVVRVNDIQLNLINGNLLLAGIDVGTPGLLRRLGLLEIADRVSKTFKLKTPSNIIRWDNVELLLKDNASLRLTTSNKKLTKLHPADLADILEELQGEKRSALFKSLDMETAAETLEYMEDDAGLALFKTLSDETAADILEEMSPDEAVDLLQDLPSETATKLLDLMEPKEAEDVKELLAYGENTAGGMMSTEFIGVTGDNSCQQAIELIRELSPETELVYYIYVLDEEHILKGAVSLRDIIVNNPSTILESIMTTNLVVVRDDAGPDEVVELVEKYGLMAVPVVDKIGELKGIITFDDVIDLMVSNKK